MGLRDPFRTVEWAGIAVRMSDGTLYAFELEGYITGEVRVETERDQDLPGLGFWSTYRPGRTEVHVELHGTGKTSAAFRDTAERQAPKRAIAEVQRAIEEGDHG